MWKACSTVRVCHAEADEIYTKWYSQSGYVIINVCKFEQKQKQKAPSQHTHYTYRFG